MTGAVKHPKMPRKQNSRSRTQSTATSAPSHLSTQLWNSNPAGRPLKKQNTSLCQRSKNVNKLCNKPAGATNNRQRKDDITYTKKLVPDQKPLDLEFLPSSPLRITSNQSRSLFPLRKLYMVNLLKPTHIVSFRGSWNTPYVKGYIEKRQFCCAVAA